MTRTPRASRGFVLVAVVIVVAAAILVATGALFTARAATVGTRAGDSERALRAAALDGVATVAESLSSQRREILAGATPALAPAVLTLADGDASIEVRAMPLGNGETLESENAKLDINAATPAALSSLVAEESSEAQELVERLASARPLASVDGAAALVDLASRGPALRALLGPLRTLGEPEDGGSGGGGDARTPRPVVSLLSAHAREALVAQDGARRLDLVAAFDDRAGASLAEFEDAERETLARLVESLGASDAAGEADGPVDDGAIARALLARGVAAERIDAMLDRATLAPGDTAPARLDIVRADARALAALPGIDRETAGRIVDLRESLDDRERLGVSWILSRRVVDAERFGRIAGRITHRSTMWRFRVEARRVTADRGDAASPFDARDGGGGDGRSSRSASGPSGVSDAVAAFDCIVDVAGESPRIVYLRDVSMLPAARLLLATQVAGAAAGGASDAAESTGSLDATGDARPDRRRVSGEPTGSDADRADADRDAAAPARSLDGSPSDSPFAARDEVQGETAPRPLDESARPATIDRPARRVGSSRTGRDVVPEDRSRP